MGPHPQTQDFLCYFKQGRINEGNFTITKLPNKNCKTIDNTNVNNTDVWLYAVDADGNNTELWTKVDPIEGNNIIYNPLAKDVRNIYGVLTKTDDKISLIFPDGVFGNLPNGAFRVYYRTSRNPKHYTYQEICLIIHSN